MATNSGKRTMLQAPLTPLSPGNPNTVLWRLLAVGLLFIWLNAVLGERSGTPSSADKVPEPTLFINQRLGEKWKANDLQPSERTGDLEFLRRVFLDIIGRIPTVDEVLDFEKDKTPDKRSRLIDHLLQSNEYARNWANIWTDWLLTKSSNPFDHQPFSTPRMKHGSHVLDHPYLGSERFGNEVYREQLRAWLKEEFTKNVSYKHLVERLLTASGKSTENGAVNFTLAHLGKPIPYDVREEGYFDMVPITIRTARLFLGYRIFPLETPELESRDWNLRRFWGLNAFFRQVEPKEKFSFALDGRHTFQELSDDLSVNQDGIVYYEGAAGRVMIVRAELFGVKMAGEAELTRRAKLARMLTSQEQFSRAFVNRMWGHFFGRGLNQWPTVDDFGELDPVEHPELLDGLAKDLAAGGYDAKKLIRWVCNSDAYQIQSTANSSNGKKDAEAFFSRMPLKLMSPEQLFDSILVAAQMKSLKAPEPKKNMRQKCFKHFFIYLGDEFADEVTFNHPILDRHLQDLMTMIRVLEDQNAFSIQESETLAKALTKKNPPDTLDLLCIAALGRHPSQKETDWFLKELQTTMNKQGQDITQFWEDLFWALVNSNEFIMNH